MSGRKIDYVATVSQNSGKYFNDYVIEHIRKVYEKGLEVEIQYSTCAYEHVVQHSALILGVRNEQ